MLKRQGTEKFKKYFFKKLSYLGPIFQTVGLEQAAPIQVQRYLEVFVSVDP